jgi:hypothetical protein
MKKFKEIKDKRRENRSRIERKSVGSEINLEENMSTTLSSDIEFSAESKEGTAVSANESEKSKNQSIFKKGISDKLKLQWGTEEKKQNLHEAYEEIKVLKKRIVLLEELFDIMMPEHLLDFSNLEEEIRKIKTRNLDSQLQIKRAELAELISSVGGKLNEESKELLDVILETQSEVTKTGNSFAKKQLERVKVSLSKKLTIEEIQLLLDKQNEIAQLDVQLAELVDLKDTEAQIQQTELLGKLD